MELLVKARYLPKKYSFFPILFIYFNLVWSGPTVSYLQVATIAMRFLNYTWAHISRRTILYCCPIPNQLSNVTFKCWQHKKVNSRKEERNIVWRTTKELNYICIVIPSFRCTNRYMLILVCHFEMYLGIVIAVYICYQKYISNDAFQLNIHKTFNNTKLNKKMVKVINPPLAHTYLFQSQPVVFRFWT